MELMGIYNRSLLPAQNTNEIFQERVRPVRADPEGRPTKRAPPLRPTLFKEARANAAGIGTLTLGLLIFDILGMYLQGRVRALTTGSGRSTRNELKWGYIRAVKLHRQVP